MCEFHEGTTRLVSKFVSCRTLFVAGWSGYNIDFSRNKEIKSSSKKKVPKPGSPICNAFVLVGPGPKIPAHTE